MSDRTPRGRRGGGVGAAISRVLRRRPKPFWLLIVTDVLLAVLVLLVFALFHHVIPRDRSSVGITSSRTAAVAQVTAAPAVAPTAAAIAATEAPVIDGSAETTAVSDSAFEDQLTAITDQYAGQSVPGDFSAVFADHFTSGSVEQDATHYRSANIDVVIHEYYKDPPDSKRAGQRYHVAEFWVKDISSFRTIFAQDKYGRNVTENIVKASKRVGSVLALSGDFYGIRHGGACIRNGTLHYAEEVVRDICVLYWDGSIQCFTKDQFDADAAMAMGAYQCWNFGPALLDGNGNKLESYDSIYEDVAGNAPRSLLGYYEPGHYCFIAVDGRSDDSRGMTLTQLADMAVELGLKQCYNMDGGGTAMMTYGEELISVPYNDGRDCSDYLVLFDRTF